MDLQKKHFRHILLYYFRKGVSAAEATRKLRRVYGAASLKERQCRNWFWKFRTGDFSLKDEPHTGRPNEAIDNDIIELINDDPHISIRGISERLHVHFSTVDRHLQRLGYINEQNIWNLRKHRKGSDTDSISKPIKSIKNEINKQTSANSETFPILSHTENETKNKNGCTNVVEKTIPNTK